MVNHPGKTITIYEVGGLVGEAFLQSFTPKNICSGFRATGIEPFNADIFPEEAFLSSYVTDRPNPEQCQLSQPQTEEIPAKPSPMTIEPTPGPSNEKLNLNQNEQCPGTSKLITPQQIRPFPKAAPRKMATRRKIGKSLILTNTPIKESLEEEAKNREDKKNKQQKVNETKRQAVTKRILESSSSASEENISYHKSSDSQ